jgi:hypothetical protein
MYPIHFPKHVGGQVEGAAFRPVLVHVFAHLLHVIGNERFLRRLMLVSPNLHWSIAKSARQVMKAVEGGPPRGYGVTAPASHTASPATSAAAISTA